MKVSVVVPIYNVEKYVSKCLDSILDQTMQDFEVVVVDDCSPDGSMEIVRSYAEKDPRFKIVTHEVNRGLMQVRKSGYSMAEGDYVMFCDSDDYLPKDAMEKMYDAALRTSADVVSGDIMLFFPKTGEEIPRESSLKYGGDMISVYKSMLLSEYQHNLCAKLFKRSLLQSYEYTTLENFTNGEDAYLLYQIVEHVKKVVHLNETVYYYRQDMESWSNRRFNHQAVHSILKVNEQRLQLAERHPSIKKYTEQKVTQVLNKLYAWGYDKDADLDSQIEEFGMTQYGTWYSALKYCPLPQACKILIKRYYLKR